MNNATLIQPAEVKRNEYGHWDHPDLPAFEGTDEAGPDAPKWKDWLAAQQLEVCRFELEGEDDNHPAYKKYFDGSDPDISEWNPQPEGEGWFLLSICDTDDGPMAWFARRVQVPA